MIKKGVTDVPYRERVYQRGLLHYMAGLAVRFLKHVKYSRRRRIARRNGAMIGGNSIIPLQLARKANANLTVGHSTVISASNIDLRSKVTVGDHVIINADVHIIRASHDVDDPFYSTVYNDLIIEDYSWLCTGCTVMHQVSRIGRGAVIGAYSVLAAGEVQPMQIMAGNPAREVKKRQQVHDQLVVESLRAGDFKMYRKCRRWFR